MTRQQTLYIDLSNERDPRYPDSPKPLCTITNVEPGDAPRVGDDIELLYDAPDKTGVSYLDLYRVDRVVFNYNPPPLVKDQEWVIDRGTEKNIQIHIFVHLVERKLI